MVDQGLLFNLNNKDSDLIVYTNANQVQDYNRQSTGGYISLLYSIVISWYSKRQATVALLSYKAKYIGETKAAKEAIQLRRLLANFSFRGSETVKILSNNRGVLALAKNPKFYLRTKHINIRYHFVREKVEEGLVEVAWTGTKANVVDSITKPLIGTSF